jgi:predicted nucleotidyltransferase
MKTLIEVKHTEIVDLCRRYRVRKLELFGSAANGRFDPETSDLDFLVDFDTIPHGEHANCYFSLLFALKDLASSAESVGGKNATWSAFPRLFSGIRLCRRPSFVVPEIEAGKRRLFEYVLWPSLPPSPSPRPHFTGARRW